MRLLPSSRFSRGTSIVARLTKSSTRCPKRFGRSCLTTLEQRISGRRHAKHVPGHLPIGPDLFHEFVEPDVSCVQGFVEDSETGRAHAAYLPSQPRPFELIQSPMGSKISAQDQTLSPGIAP